MKIYLASEGFDVAPMQAALAAHPELWNQHKGRTGYGPHSQVSDIWVRYNAFENFERDPSTFNDEHESVWYPAAQVLPVRTLVFDVMRQVEGERLGGILITRIPPGGQVEPHVDHGWHARYYEKFAIQVMAAPEQRFCFEGESLITKPGDLFWFENSYSHWVTNDSPVERITMICCIRRSY